MKINTELFKTVWGLGIEYHARARMLLIQLGPLFIQVEFGR